MSFIANKPNFNNGTWADGGIIVTPSVDKIYEGHVVEKPKAEIVNWIENRQDTAILHLLQQGISTWDYQTTYPQNAYVKHNGTVYKALSQNIDADPSNMPSIWVIAFADYQAYEDLAEQVRNIRQTNGYLSHYVKISDPIMTAPAKGVGYMNRVATNKGLTFKDNNNNPQIKGGGDYNFDGTYNQSNDVIRRSDLDAILKVATQMRVGDLYFTTVSTNPATTLGYGTWEQYAQGRAIVGVSTSSSSNPSWTKSAGGTAGSYEHTLTVSELPPHKHQFLQPNVNGGISVSGGASNTLGWRDTSETGGGQPHNNVQPSIAVFIWRRVS